MGEKFLNKVYEARGFEETRALYDAWSASYEDEVGEHGYATPGRCARALAGLMTDLNTPVLDFGCGTGLSGAALHAAGFTTIDGVDLSADMLKEAAAKGIYRSLRQIEAGEAPVQDGQTCDAISVIGVIGSGAAPLDTFDMLMNILAPGGKLVLSFNDHTLEDPAYEGRLSEWTDTGAARLLFREHGAHLPGINLNSTVYVIEKV